jgi:Tol biopolymer transport system component
MPPLLHLLSLRDSLRVIRQTTIALAALSALAVPLPARADLTVLYDSGGFEGFAAGSLVSVPQDGWTGTALDGAIDPEIVSIAGDKKLRLAVPNGDPPLDRRKESRVAKSFTSPLFLSGMTHIVIECDLTLDADGNAQRQNLYFDFEPQSNKFLPDAQIVQDNNYVQMVRGGDQTHGIDAAGNDTFHMSWDFDLQAGTVTSGFGTRTIDAASAVLLQSIIGDQPGEDPDGNPNTFDAMSFGLVSDWWEGPGDAVLLDNFIVRGDPIPVPPPGTVRPRTVLLSYDPILESQGGVRLHTYAGWNDPHPLTQEYIADLTSVSHGWQEPRLTQNVVIDAFPLKMDGFRYTDQTYVEGLQGGGWHAPDEVDYKAVVRDFDLARRVDRGEIDEVVVHGAPYFGYYESRMAGRGGYWCNSGPLQRTACSKVFIMMGLNYERGVGEEIHSYGHRSESIMSRTFGSWDIMESRHDWERFTHNIGQSPDAACGSVHWPPNAAGDYDYANPAVVTSTAIDWETNFPNLNGQSSPVSSATWGGPDYQRNYLKWWYEHMPHRNGSNSHDGLTRWNTWWPYLADLNRWPEAGGAQPLGGLPPVAPPLGINPTTLIGMPGDEWGPVWDGVSVWYGSDGSDYEIVLNGGDYTWQLTHNDYDDEAPAVGGGRVVWQGFDGQDWEIFSTDTGGGVVHQITSNTVDDRHPQVNAAGSIVWDSFDGTDYEIYAANGDGTGVTRITNNSGPGSPRDDVWPRINDAGRVVWQGHDGTNWEIWSASSDGAGLVNVSNNNLENESPRINANGHVVWHAWHDEGNSEIWSARCTGGTATRITMTAGPDWYPEINASGRVAWMAMTPEGDWEVMAADSTGGNMTQITTNDIPDQYPVIDDEGRIAWQGLDGNDWEIYLLDEGTVYQASNNDLDDRGPFLRAGRLLWTLDNIEAGGVKNSDIQAIDLTGAGDVAEDSGRLQLRLLAPRPNPAARDVALTYELPRIADVELSIFDATGRERARMRYDRVAPGRHEIRWDGRSVEGRPLPGGVYFARMKALGASRSVRVLLVR